MESNHSSPSCIKWYNQELYIAHQYLWGSRPKPTKQCRGGRISPEHKFPLWKPSRGSNCGNRLAVQKIVWGPWQWWRFNACLYHPSVMIDSHDDEDWKLILILDLYLLTIVMMKILVRLMVMRRQKNIIRPLSKLKDVQYFMYMCGLQRSS